MRVVVVGATGNVGTSLLDALADEPAVGSIVGVARRRPSSALAKTEWVTADIGSDPLDGIFEDADALVHLAWNIQPSHDLNVCWRTNVLGSERVFRAAARVGIQTIVYASSVGAYSPGPKDRRVDETWPTDGVPTSFYSRHKAEVEARLDRFENDNPSIRVVRLRPALIFKREAASGIRRLFLGPFVPTNLIRPSLIPVVPDIPRLRFQAVHSTDVAQAYRLALVKDVVGAFNVAADPVIDPEVLGRLIGAKPVRVRPSIVRRIAHATWRLHLQPSPEGWLDMGLQTPLLDSSRAHAELGWEPRYSATEALMELLEGFRAKAGRPTPPLDPSSGGPMRSKEIFSGVGVRP